MKRTPRIVVVTLILLASVLVATVPASAGENEKVTTCHMPGTPAQKTLMVPKKAVAGHLSHGDELNACTTESSSPSGADEPAKEVKITICHKPGTPAQKTLTVSPDSESDHLDHGDYLGPCTAEAPAPTKPAKVTLCHKPGSRAEKMLAVAPESLTAHLDHGDYLGFCTTNPVVVMPPHGNMAQMAICHKPGEPAEATLQVSPEAVADHLNHGDYLGFCGEEPPSLEEWAMPYVRCHHSPHPVPV